MEEDNNSLINGYPLNSQFLIIDVETNGLPTRRNAHYSEIDVWPRIVQISWGIYDVHGNYLRTKENTTKLAIKKYIESLSTERLVFVLKYYL